MSTLVIIEAPGKVQALSHILDGLDFEAKVFATKGHLYANPEDITILGIDSSYREVMRTPINPERIEEIILAAEDVDYVIIATDPDQEGDAIAKDVADLFPGKNLLRARFHGLDEESVKAGLKEIGKYNEELAWPGIGRRVLDRMIGFFMTTEVKVPSGRVQSAILGAVGTRPTPYAELNLVLPASDGGESFRATLPVTWANTEEMVKLNEAARTLEPVPVDDSKTISAVLNKPWNMGDILIESQKRVQCSVSDVQNSLQEMYEGGFMSYPRSTMRGVGQGALDCLEKIADRSNLKHLFNRDRIARLDQAGAHAAPHPLVDHFEISMPMKLMNHHEAIRALITRNLLLSGIEQQKEFPDVRYLPDWAKKIPWERVNTPRSIPWNTILTQAGFVKIDQKAAIIKQMMDIGVGRPGTYVNHAEKFISRGLVGKTLQLNDRGREWIEKIPVELTEYRASAKIEKYLETSGYAPEAMVATILDQLGEGISAPISAQQKSNDSTSM